MEGSVSLGRRMPWKWIGVTLVLVGGTLFGVSALFGWQERREKRAALEEAAGVYRTFRTCVLGEGVADRELGRTVAEAEASGRLDGNRYRTCRAPAVAALEAIARETEDTQIPSFAARDVPHGGDDRFDVCADLAFAARIIADQAGQAEPDIDCDPHIDPLEGVITGGTGALQRRWVDGGTLYIDEVDNDAGPAPVHHLRRSRDGQTWEELDDVAGFWDAHWSAGGAWSLAFVPGDKTAHYLVLDGSTWRPGARARRGREIEWRRTEAGWTLILDAHEGGVEVMWLDPLMERVLGHQRAPALDERFTWQARQPAASIDERGDATLYRLAATDQSVEIVAHVISPRGAGAPSTLRLPLERPSPDLALTACSKGPVTFLVVPTHAVVSSSGGASLTLAQSGGLPAPRSIECSGQRLAFADTRQLARCDASRCKVERIPLADHVVAGRTRIDLADDGRGAQLVVANQDRAYRFADGPDGTLALQDIWTWSHAIRGGSVRLGDLWFVL